MSDDAAGERQWAPLMPAVEREIRKARLTPREVSALRVLLDRIQERRTQSGDVDNLSPRPLLEARLAGDHRIFRLLYAERGDGLVLVAVLFTAKKSRRLSPTTLDTAERRLRRWDEGHE